jgi:hypothetical protein
MRTEVRWYRPPLTTKHNRDGARYALFEYRCCFSLHRGRVFEVRRDVLQGRTRAARTYALHTVPAGHSLTDVDTIMGRNCVDAAPAHGHRFGR